MAFIVEISDEKTGVLKSNKILISDLNLPPIWMCTWNMFLECSVTAFHIEYFSVLKTFSKVISKTYF